MIFFIVSSLILFDELSNLYDFLASIASCNVYGFGYWGGDSLLLLSASR